MDTGNEIIEEKKEEIQEVKENDPEEILDEEDKVKNPRKFDLLTMIAGGSMLLFVIFFFIDYLNYRWWLMLPLAFISALSSFLQIRSSRGFEKKICWIIFLTVVSFFVIRDIDLSNGMANVYDGIKNFAKALKQP